MIEQYPSILGILFGDSDQTSPLLGVWVSARRGALAEREPWRKLIEDANGWLDLGLNADKCEGETTQTGSNTTSKVTWFVPLLENGDPRDAHRPPPFFFFFSPPAPPSPVSALFRRFDRIITSFATIFRSWNGPIEGPRRNARVREYGRTQ